MTMVATETRNVGPLVVKVFPDYNSDQECPLEYLENIKFATFERNSTLRDYNDFSSLEELKEWAKKNRYDVFPLFKYNHSLVSYSIRSFIGRAHHAEWDSGQAGFVLVKKSAYRKARRAKIAENLCESVTRWCNGDYYGYTIEENDEIIESCWGFDDEKYCLKEAMQIARYINKTEKNKNAQ